MNVKVKESYEILNAETSIKQNEIKPESYDRKKNFCLKA